MTRIYFNVPDEMAKDFLRAIGRKYGANRGVIERAAKEAVELWMAEEKGDLAAKYTSVNISGTVHLQEEKGDVVVAGKQQKGK